MSPQKPLVEIPPWPAFAPVASNPSWNDFERLARSNINAHHAELSILMDRVNNVPLTRKGPNGELLLTTLLQGWGNLENTFTTCREVEDPSLHLARLPIPGEDPWDGTGVLSTWTLPAAALVARGANPFEEGPDGTRPWDWAVNSGVPELVQQMLRCPSCPRKDGLVDWEALELRPTGAGSNPRDTSIRQPYDKATTNPLKLAAMVPNPTLARVLCEAGARMSMLEIDVTRCTNQDKMAAIIGILAEHGADPVEENDRGLTPLEQMAMQASLGPELRCAWGKAAARSVPPDRQHRAVAAALFAGGMDTLRLLPGRPRGKAWRAASPGVPQGLSWVEWAALGVMARSSSMRGGGRPNTTAMTNLPIPRDQMTARERAWTHIGASDLRMGFEGVGAADVTNHHAQAHIRDIMAAMDIIQPGRAIVRTIVSKEMHNGFRPDLCAMAAELMLGEPHDKGTLALAVLTAPKDGPGCDDRPASDNYLGEAVLALARAQIIQESKEAHVKDPQAVAAGVASLLARAAEAGHGPGTLGEEDERALREGLKRMASNNPLRLAWEDWIIRCHIPQADPRRQRVKNRL